MKKTILFIALLFIYSPCFLHAEEQKIYNLAFEYYVSAEIDQEQQEIKIGEDSRVIKVKDLSEFLVAHYFFRSKVDYLFPEIRDFAESAISEGNASLIYLVVKKVIATQGWSYAQVAEILNMLSIDLLKQIARKDQFEFDYQLSKGTSGGKYFLLLAMEYYSPNFIKNCCSKPFSLDGALAHYLQDQLSKGASPAEIINNIYRKKSEALSPEDLKRIEKILSSLQILGNLDADFPKTYKSLQTNYASYYDSLKPLLLNLRALALQEALKRKSFQLAFDLLILQDVQERTETTHQQLKEILKSMDLGFAPILMINPYKEYVAIIADKDLEVKDLLVSKLEEITENLIASNKIFEAKEYLSEIFTYRPNPNLTNANIAFILIEALDQKQLRDQVYLIRDSYQLEYSLSQKFWFLKNGYYFNLIFVWIFFFGLVACAVLVYLNIIKLDKLRSLMKKYLKKMIALSPVQESILDNQFNQQFEQLNSDRQKYKSLLKYFELKENASLDDIKSRFRKKVKAYHPDLNPTQTEFDKTKFLEISERYDDLVSLFNRFGPK